MAYDPQCKRCPLSESRHNDGTSTRTICMPGVGPQRAEIMIVGDAPSSEDDAQGVPFANDDLTSLLARAGLDRSQVFFTYTARCRPPNNRAPKASEQASCFTYLAQEIADVQPKVIITVGSAALTALTGVTNIGKHRNKPLPVKPLYRTAAQVIATFSPAAARHNPGQRDRIYSDIISDLRFAKRIAIPDTTNYTAIAGGFDDHTDEALAALEASSMLACDLEWENIPGDGSWPWSIRFDRRPRLVSIGLAGRTAKGNVIGVALAQQDQRYAERVRALLASKPLIFHLGLETPDLIWLQAYNYEFSIGGDTYSLARLLNIEAPDFGLKTLAPMLTDFPSGWANDANGLVGVMPQTRDEWVSLLRYNARDCIATFLLHEALAKHGLRSGRHQVMRFYANVFRHTLPLFAEMALEGLPFNVEAWRKREHEARAEITVHQQRVADALGVSRYDIISSPVNLALTVERVVGVTLPRTPTGKPSLAEDIRLALMQTNPHPVFEALNDLAHAVKAHSTYYKPWLHLFDMQGDSRLHSLYRPTGASTGRTSSSAEEGASSQQLTRGPMRDFVEAPEGWSIVSVDASQIELRLVAEQSRDERMMRYFKEGKDLHRMTGAFMLAITSVYEELKRVAQEQGRNVDLQYAAQRALDIFLRDEDAWAAKVTKDVRQGAKPVNFGLCYGGSPDVLIRTARADYNVELSREQAEIFSIAYFTLYPGVKRWHEDALAIANAGGVWTMFNRWRTFQVGKRPDQLVREAVNTPTQSAGNDIALSALALAGKLRNEDPEFRKYARFIGYVHDSIMMLVRDDYVDRASTMLFECMKNPPLEEVGVHLEVPLDAEVQVGRTWWQSKVVLPAA